MSSDRCRLCGQPLAEGDHEACRQYEAEREAEAKFYREEKDRFNQICALIEASREMFTLNGVQQRWEARMKDLAAERLKPGSDEPIEDLDALDYIWHLHGDYCITGDQVYHRRAIDYYLGRKVPHVWGEGVLMKIMTREDYEQKLLPKDQEYFNASRVFFSDPKAEHPLPARGINYGIRLDYPCQCGEVNYEMFAIPGVHNGGFAYLVCEDDPHYLDVRNQCRVCEACEPVLRQQLEDIDAGKFDHLFDEDDDDGNP